MKNKKKIKESIFSHFNKRKGKKAVDILPKDVTPVPQIIEPIRKEKEKKSKKKKKNYIPQELNETILKLSKKIDFISKQPKDYLNIKTIEKHYNKDTNNKTIEKHYNKDTNNKTTEKHYNNTQEKQRIINIPKEIKIPTIINPPSTKEKGLNNKNVELKETKIENIHKNINKILFQNSKNENKHLKTDIRNNKHIKIPTITNKTENPFSFVVNKTNMPNKVISKVLNSHTDTNNKNITKKSYSIDKSTVNKILSGKVQVPKTIPAYQYGGPVQSSFGGKLVLAGEAGENEVIVPNSKIKTVSREALPNAINKTDKTMSSIASETMMQNAALKTDKISERPKTESAQQSPSVVVQNNTSSGGNGGASIGGGGGSTKATTAIGIQTQYPIWRRGLG